MHWRHWRRLAWVPAAAAALALADVGVQDLRRSLERESRSLDLPALLARAGLSGRTASLKWDRSRFVLLPRPALVLEGIDLRLLSGQPGSGAASGQLRLRELKLIPGWQWLTRGRLQRIEADGGSCELGSDLVPQLPRDYLDPIDGTRRPVPWTTLLAVTADSIPAPRRPFAGMEREPWRLGEGEEVLPQVVVRNFEIRLAAFDVLPGYSLSIHQARWRGLGESRDLQGLLSVVPARGAPFHVPLRFSQVHLRGGWQWRARLGSEGAGCEVEVRPASGEPFWSVRLQDPRGRLADAFLENRSGALTRLRWRGSWDMQATGRGRFPNGLEETRIALLAGRLFLEGAPAGPQSDAEGVLLIHPGRVDLPALRLRSGTAAGDTARLHLEWLETTRGKHVRGQLAGKLDPAWLALAGPGWLAAGGIQCQLGFEADRDHETGNWSLIPHGRMEGNVDSLSGPWFLHPLRSGKINLWTEHGSLHLLVVGRFGGSPFRLEGGGLPLPANDYLGRVAQAGSWSFQSPWCRLEDFQLASDLFPEAGAAPFWLLLPGAGSVRIARGSLGGVLFDSLTAATEASERAFQLDTLGVRLGQGRFSAARIAGVSAPGGRNEAGETRLRLAATQLDLKTVQSLLAVCGFSLHLPLEGKLSGRGWLRAPEGLAGLPAAYELQATAELRDGVIRGIPLPSLGKMRSLLPDLSTLSFRDWRAELRLDPTGAFCNQMELNAPPVEVDGACRVARGRVQAALVLRPQAGSKAADGLLSLWQGSQLTLYCVVKGPWETASVELASRSAFLQEMERLGGALPPGKKP